MKSPLIIKGAGLGLKRDFINQIQPFSSPENNIDFFEIAPENWMNTGGKYKKLLNKIAQDYQIVCHGLSLSLGSSQGVNKEFLYKIKDFLDEYNVNFYSEHISYTSYNGNLYDLLPLPFTQESINIISNNILTTQDILKRPIAIENTSYYVESEITDMKEYDFISEVVKKTDCFIHLDVNNIYVNSINFGFNPYDFIDNLPAKVIYGHVAGHYMEHENLAIDTHGENVKDDVWLLLEYAYKKFGVYPTLLERDSNIPEFNLLVKEIDMIKKIQNGMTK